MPADWRRASALWLIGCGSADDPGSTGGITTTGAGADSSSTGPAWTSAGATTRSTTTTTVGTTSSESSDDAASDDGVFIHRPDGGGGVSIECDVWAEDCPDGMKCMPWANGGGMVWNATKCVEVVRDPRQPGEACTVQDSLASGVDDCELHSMCWGVDPDSLMGECYAFCSGSEANPICEDPQSFCPLTAESVLILCLPRCHPFTQPCPSDEVCVPMNGEFGCAPDEGGAAGGFGDPCEFVNVCDPGLFCANPDAVPGCVGSSGCCTPFCELTAVQPAQEQGVECIPWFEEGQAPRGFETLGACEIPA